ncbi:LacI family DNA-binding transcriptional regulator [Edaphobacter sp.]|uniref:LacI family DNA-binding transcriptional regulator n=1 Tax=Edaphobacter sp. TaxID=1934404 RepID=UPI002DBC8D3C|nr:LacI family DNA-binding transcriptional regulator [Edaphobacter sp.]HEU5341246.1 LacI family DNA-binding transcriptional regulator [Edaphobacter sp.]
MNTTKAPQHQFAQNMKTVARLAGVSHATVSRVINGTGLVLPATAERVRKAIEQLGFIPNPSGTTLRYGRSKVFGLILPDLTNPFYPEFLLNFERALVATEHEVMLATTQVSSPELARSVRRMLMRRVDGVVLMASEFDTRSIEPLLSHRVPIVTIDRRITQKGAADVAIDFETGYLQAAIHLKKLGHRRIGFIGGSEGLVTSKVRLKAFQTALEDVGLNYDEKLTRMGDYRVTGGRSAMQSLLALRKRPTAVMTVNDLTAFGALRALHDAKISVPDEISIVGCDGSLLGEVFPPGLTSIAVSFEEMSRKCLGALHSVKANIESKGPLLVVPSTLVIRGSTGPA